MSDIPVELTDPTADLAEAMRARMGITDDGGENDEVEDQELEDQEPTDEVEDPNHDDANQPVVEGSGEAVPRMGADGGGGGQEAEPPVEVEDVPEFIQFGSIRIPRSQEQELEQLYPRPASSSPLPRLILRHRHSIRRTSSIRTWPASSMSDSRSRSIRSTSSSTFCSRPSSGASARHSSSTRSS